LRASIWGDDQDAGEIPLDPVDGLHKRLPPDFVPASEALVDDQHLKPGAGPLEGLGSQAGLLSGASQSVDDRAEVFHATPLCREWGNER